jgi:hypothetical protein
MFLSFSPAISKDALNKISEEVRHWRIHRRIGSAFVELAKMINPILAGWMHITAGSTGRRCIPSCCASMPTWCAGSVRSTNG